MAGDGSSRCVGGDSDDGSTGSIVALGATCRVQEGRSGCGR